MDAIAGDGGAMMQVVPSIPDAEDNVQGPPAAAGPASTTEADVTLPGVPVDESAAGVALPSAPVVVSAAGAAHEAVVTVPGVPVDVFAAGVAMPSEPVDGFGCQSYSSMESHGVKVASAQAAADVEKAVSAAGQVPAGWASRSSVLQEAQSYKRGSVVVDRVLTKEGFSDKTRQQAKAIQATRETGLVGSRAVADVVVAPGANPFAVDQLGINVIRGFRIKSMSLLVLQAVLVLAFALAADAVFSPMHPSAYVLCGFAIASSCSLLLVAYIRHRYPWNYIGELCFTVLAGITFGLMSHPLAVVGAVDRLQLHALGAYCIGLLVLGLGSILMDRGERVAKCLHLAMFGAVIGCAALGASWATLSFCPVFPLLLSMFILAMSLVWVGAECDKMASKLNPDEYLMPVLLVWADLLVVAAVSAAVVFLCCLAGDCGGDGGSFPACGYYCYCDCCTFWLYDQPGSSNNDRNQEKRKGDAPTQHEMP